MESCSKCGGTTEGFKCDVCGAEADVHVEDHSCGGEHCMPKCKACGEAQVKCTCSQGASPITSKASPTRLFTSGLLSISQ